MGASLKLRKAEITRVAMCLVAGGIAATTIGDKASQRLQAADPPSERLVAHEWGTFTSFAGSNGVKLEFRPLVDNDLPPFVVDRWTQDGALDPATAFSKRSVRAYQRMETPVIYFYSDVEREVRVKVGFPQGLITEFFPPLASQQPAPTFKDTASAKNSVIDWGPVWVIPNSSLKSVAANESLARGIERRMAKSLPPLVFSDEHYGQARATDSAMLYVNRPKDESKPIRPSGDFFEKFLFYRGVGNFDLPVTMRALGKGEFAVRNTGSELIASLFLVNVQNNKVKFARYGELSAKHEMKMTSPNASATVDELAEAVVSALVEAKLYEKEARAMVATWRDSWFREEGTRLFYLLPQRTTDELLPLEISPQPDELVRVLVGRLEVMTPEAEQQMTAVVRGSAQTREAMQRQAAKNSADVPQVQPQLPDSIRRMGRLAEPMLTRVKETATDESIRREAGLLLSQLNSAIMSAGAR